MDGCSGGGPVAWPWGPGGTEKGHGRAGSGKRGPSRGRAGAGWVFGVQFGGPAAVRWGGVWGRGRLGWWGPTLDGAGDRRSWRSSVAKHRNEAERGLGRAWAGGSRARGGRTRKRTGGGVGPATCVTVQPAFVVEFRASVLKDVRFCVVEAMFGGGLNAGIQTLRCPSLC